MENTEIMNEEFIEEAGEIVTGGSGHGWKIAGGILAAIGAAYGGYKIWSKKKADKKTLHYTTIPVESTDLTDECVEVSE